MVTGSGMEEGTEVLSAGVRSTIQSIKDIVKNHADADIYAALKENGMDPNETIQKLLNQDTFHEVKRKRDRRKETAAQKVLANQAKLTDLANRAKLAEDVGRGVKPTTQLTHIDQKGGYNPVKNPGYGRKLLPASTNGAVIKAFRIVRDNRVSSSTNVEMKTSSLQHPSSSSHQIELDTSERGPAGSLTNPKTGGQGHSQVCSHPSSSSQDPQTSWSNTGNTRKQVLEEPTKISRGQEVKAASSLSHSTKSGSSNSVVGLYSSTDPVHVPSPDSRASSAVGAIKREVGVVGVRRISSEDSLKRSSTSAVSSNPQLREYSPSESFRSLSAISKTDHLSQPAVTQSLGSTMSGNRTVSSSQYGGKQNQQTMGHQKGIKEWKPKSSQKSVSSGVSRSPKSTQSSDNKPKDCDAEAPKLQGRLSQMSIQETPNVIIAQHIRVPDTDRYQLTFGSFDTEYEPSKNLDPGRVREESHGQSATGSPIVDPVSLGDNDSVSKADNTIDERVGNSRSDSPASSASSDNQSSEKKEPNPQILDSYSDIGLVREDTHSYNPSESNQQQDPSEIPSFTAYDPQAGYDLPYFRTSVEEAVRGQSLQSPTEALTSHAENNIPASTLSLEHQQQHPHPVAAQMYPQVHVSHFANLMPYRQFLSPVYVPPMALPGYSSNPAYPSPHPSNGNSYMLMPGAATSHLSTSGLKYGIQQFKPVPAGSPTGFGNFSGPAGYAVNASGGVVGNANGMDDSRMKYKDNNIYVSNPQGEASEIWIQNPREMAGLQSTPYYGMTGQTPHAAAYLPSHTGHASFNAAATQSSHMQFPGLYHPSPQPTAIAGAHHLGPAMGGNIGVGVAAAGPVPQVGAYQQPQLGQFNWTTNF
ncbi:hypothetical protein SAY86_002320 [Trapa natans]|uniref:GBF-interacting protein 1 N-terminal domain-containing protein n=1 Tax=Trapa natans TaxID=22666 RepID=A0AAN7LS97_TRANT|nr:hypothetical protein SAY86_002320 [Trapa natans]